MPHTASAKKRLRQNETRRTRNRASLKMLKTHLKRVETAATEGDAAKLNDECKVAAQKHDQAAARGIIHRNRASRVKSHLAAVLTKAGKGAAAPKPAAK
jgi:small subunit ribosomal protein S20